MMRTKFLLAFFIVSCTSQEFQVAVPLDEPVFEIAVPLAELVVDEKIAAPTGGPATEKFTLPPVVTPALVELTVSPFTTTSPDSTTTSACREVRTCQTGYIWFDFPNCFCRSRCGDYIRPCPMGQRWDFTACACLACPPNQCEPNYAPNGKGRCECECVLQQSSCPAGTEVIDCACQPIISTQTQTTTTLCPQVTCRNNYVWLQEQCQCVCPPMACPTGTIRGNDCNCIPVATTCPPTECPGQGVFNPVTCNCDCALTDETCPGPRGYVNFDVCECRRRPCDPPWPCPKNQVISWELCRCVDAITTTTSTSTTRCRPTTCKRLFIWSQKDCKCVCRSQPCRRGFIWKAHPICKCELKCNYVGKCRAGYRWDQIKCDCVRACPRVTCRRNQVVDVNTCKCIFENSQLRNTQSPPPTASTIAPVKTTTPCLQVSCRNFYRWVQERCRCECPPYWCPPGTYRGNDCNCLPNTTTAPVTLQTATLQEDLD